MKDQIKNGIRALNYLERIYDQQKRIIMLVQLNQDFFDNPLPGDSALKVAADKLESLIKEATQLQLQSDSAAPRSFSATCP